MFQSLSLSDIEPEQNDISILNNILLSFLHVFPFSLHCILIAQQDQIIVFHDFSADEALLEVSVDHSSSLWSLGKLSNSPAPHLVSSRSEVVDEIESVIACLNDFRNHSPLLLVFVFELSSFVLSTVGNDLPGDIGIDKIFYLLQPFILLAHEIFSTEVHKVDNRFSCNEGKGIQNGNLTILPLSVPHPFVTGQNCACLIKHLLLLSSLLGVVSLDELFEVFEAVVDVLEILEDELGVNDLHISDGVH